MPSRPASPPRWLHPAILCLSALLLLAWFTPDMSDSDAWWHLRTGQYIWQSHKLPVPDPFAYTTGMGKPAYPGETDTRYFNLTHEWLAQVIFYLAYALAGFPALILFRAALLTGFCAAVGLIAFYRTNQFYRGAAAALLAATVAWRYTSDRPYLLTFLFLAVVVLMLERRRCLWLLPPLFLIWANCHGGYFLGWAALGAYCIESLWQKSRERALWIVSAIAVLACGLNPNGFRAIPILMAYRQSRLQSVLWEWQRTVFWPPQMFGIVLAAGALALVWARRRGRPADWILLFLFGGAAIAAVRNIILIGLIGPVLIATYVPWKRVLPVAAEYLAALAVLVALAVRLASGAAFQLGPADWRYPRLAADFLLAHHVTAPLFNSYENGGYLIWRLWPQERVFIDGRALNESVFQDFSRMASNAAADPTGPSGEELLLRYGIEVIVMEGFEPDSGNVWLLPAALSDPAQKEWKLVYRDAQAVIYMRHPPPGVEPLNSFDALAAFESQCQEFLEHSPAQNRCARGLAILFDQIGDAARARRWMSTFMAVRTFQDPADDAYYQRLLGGR